MAIFKSSVIFPAKVELGTAMADHPEKPYFEKFKLSRAVIRYDQFCKNKKRYGVATSDRMELQHQNICDECLGILETVRDAIN